MDFSITARQLWTCGGLWHFAKSPRPDARAKCSTWAKCLGKSRATAVKPDFRL